MDARIFIKTIARTDADAMDATRAQSDAVTAGRKEPIALTEAAGFLRPDFMGGNSGVPMSNA
jgi:hypothetical protein